MKRDQANVSPAQKSAESVPGGNEAFLQAKAAVNTCKQLEDEIKMLGLRIKRHEGKISSLKIENNTVCRAISDLRDNLSQFHILERPLTERGYLPKAVSEMATVHHIRKVDDGNISREEPQIVFPECSGTSCTPADYASLEQQIRKKGLELGILQDELQRELARLHNVKSEYLVKKNEYLRLVDEGSPQCAGSGSNTTAKID